MERRGWAISLLIHCSREDLAKLRFPTDIEVAKDLGRVLSKYKNTHYMTVLVAIVVTYVLYPNNNSDGTIIIIIIYITHPQLLLISLQTFAIPGSISLSILLGFLFPFFLALFIVCTVSHFSPSLPPSSYIFQLPPLLVQCSAVGATFCYLLSSMIGRGLVKKWLPDRLASWKRQV